MIYKKLDPGTHTNTTYSNIKNQEEIKNDILKPLHLYSQKICPKPEKYGDRYRQVLYSESIVLFENNDTISINCRAATLPYKVLKKFDSEAPENCFKTLLAFYVPWFIDIDKDTTITNCNIDNYAFYIPKNINVNFFKLYSEPRDRLEEIWVPFYIKKDTEYVKDEYAKLDRNIPIYDMIIE